ncbi:MAG: dCTP deaminase domain-containing protein [Candidatus Asgardarchaeia archaeon]
MRQKHMFATGDFVAKYVENCTKINPNGVDLAPIRIFMIPTKDIIAVLDGNKRGFLKNNIFHEVYDIKVEIEPRANGYYKIPANSIIEAVFPKVEIPHDFVGIMFPRSTLNRLGIIKSQTGLLDSGYVGTPTQTFHFLINTHISIKESWVQLTFVKSIEKVKKGYRGYYQKKII